MLFGKRGEKNRRTKSAGQVFWEYVRAIILAFILAGVIRVEVASSYQIPSGSMLPTLVVGDRILVNKIVYGLKIPLTGRRVLPLGELKRSEIIVFETPFDSPDPYIKRVIGLPGERVEIIDKQVFIDGRPLREPYARFTDPNVLPRSLGLRDNFGPIVIPPGKLFVMGDNRDNSNDSRFWGLVDLTKVIGRAEVILWSWDWGRLAPRWSRTLKSTG